MKKLLAAAILLSIFTFSASAQETETQASVVKSVSGLQIGPLGAWGYHEFKLTNSISLRAEAGLNAGFWYGTQYDGLGYIFVPVIVAEPRWYYNLNNRVRKGRDIKGNSGNFLSLQISYLPDWFIINNNDLKWNGMSMAEPEVHNQISIVPTWGIRRTLGKHFDYEAGFGLGYAYRFKYKENGYTYKGDGSLSANVHLRIGYHF